MKLSKDQIEQIKKLISYKGCPEIDVQYEILDHVACKIEELMGQEPKVTLEAAFGKVQLPLVFLVFQNWRSLTIK